MPVRTLRELFNAFKQMPYYKNHAAASGAVHNYSKHEDALAAKMIEFGYKEYSCGKLHKKDFGKEDFLSTMPPGSYIEQPFGTHSAPDFFIKGPAGRLIPLEAKSADGTKPLYNSGGIKRGYYYVFCSKKTGTTTIYRGDDIITEAQSRLIYEYIAEEKQRANELNRRLKAIDDNNRGINFYPRAMIGQSGGASFTDYFTHQNCARDEARVIDSL